MESLLRTYLRRVDGSGDSIRDAAAAMMKHYDRSIEVAVTEWRNALTTATNHQLLPLLYVANEVMQNSKRNRGNKFLEAMSPVLQQSLVHMCEQDRTIVEKVRRTVKIWADRRVFSVRFVNELLAALEPYREGHNPAPPPATTEDGASFSPMDVGTPTSSPKEVEVKNEEEVDEKDDDIMNILEDDENESVSSEEQDDEDVDVFGESSQSQKLEIDINLDLTEIKNTTPVKKRKSRRGSAMSTSSQSATANKRRKSTLSANNLSDLWHQLSELEQRYEFAEHVLKRIDDRIAKTPASELQNLVGDELQQASLQNDTDQQQMATERKNLHAIATERRSIEQEAVRYLQWLEKALKQDEDDLQFCDQLELKIGSFQKIQGEIGKARDLRKAEEKKRQQLEEERERKRKEEEENEKFRKAALAKETEARPGMVWNPTTREYQALNTDESWRD